ncbi:MAG: choice-of-anchor D domain-containing protein [archaeon]
MKKEVIVVFIICFLLISTTYVEAFSFKEVFGSIGNFFGSIFKKQSVGAPIPNCNCDSFQECSLPAIICDTSPYACNGAVTGKHGYCREPIGQETPSISVNPTSLIFDDITFGQSNNKVITISNTGTLPLNIISITTPSFISVSEQTFTVEYGQSHNIIFTFAPIQLGAYNGVIQIASNDPNQLNYNLNYAGNSLSPTLDYLLTASPVSGTAPLISSLSLSGDPPVGAQFEWHFGSQIVTNSLMNMNYIYQVGSYDNFVEVIVNGQIVGTSNHVNVASGGNPYLLTANQTSGSFPLTVSFSLQMDDPLINGLYKWHFGSQIVTNSLMSMTHVFSAAGNYNNYVEVYNNNVKLGQSNILPVSVTSPPQEMCDCDYNSDCGPNQYCDLYASCDDGPEEQLTSNIVYYSGLCKPIVNQFTLTVNKSGTGEGDVSSNPSGISCGSDCNQAYTSGTSVTLTALPMDGSTFAGWTGGICSSQSTICTVTMNSNKVVGVVFNSQFQSTYILTVTKQGSGTVTGTSNPIQTNINCGLTCSLPYISGTSVTLTASPNPGYTFSHWEGACSGTSTCTITMNSVKTATAVFSQQPQYYDYLLSANPTNGTIPLTVNFNLNGDFPINSQFRWYFGDQTITNTQTSMQHVYQNYGNYNTFVQVWNNGQMIGVSNIVQISSNANTTNATNLSYLLSANPTTGTVPLIVLFNLTGTTGPNINYTWYLGNNIPLVYTSYDQNYLQYTYQTVGNYIAYVIITETIPSNIYLNYSNNVSISVQSSPGGGGGGGGSGGSGDDEDSCMPQWSCLDWGSCSSQTKTQTRTCSDFNNCGTNEGKPSLVQSCTPTFADQLGISNLGEGISGEIQDYVNKGKGIKSTYIALILLFILIILCALLIYFRGPFRKKKLDNKLKTQTTIQAVQTPIYREIKPELRNVVIAVKKAKGDGFSKDQIEKELRSKGWKEELIREILSYI